jgi:hypothetical protein
MSRHPGSMIARVTPQSDFLPPFRLRAARFLPERQSREVGTRDPGFQVSADRTCRRTVAPADVLAVPNEWRLEGRSHVTLIVRRRHPVPLAHFSRIDQPRVLPGEDLLGDAPEGILGTGAYVAVTRGLRRAVLRLRCCVIDHLRRVRAGREGLKLGAEVARRPRTERRLRLRKRSDEPSSPSLGSP